MTTKNEPQWAEVSGPCSGQGCCHRRHVCWKNRHCASIHQECIRREATTYRRSQLLHTIHGDRRKDNPVSDLGHRWPGEIPEPRSHVPSGRRHSLASVWYYVTGNFSQLRVVENRTFNKCAMSRDNGSGGQQIGSRDQKTNWVHNRPGVRRQTQDAVHRDLGQTRDKRGGAILRLGLTNG